MKNSVESIKKSLPVLTPAEQMRVSGGPKGGNGPGNSGCTSGPVPGTNCK